MSVALILQAAASATAAPAQPASASPAANSTGLFIEFVVPVLMNIHY